jgi:hypothetical protein
MCAERLDCYVRGGRPRGARLRYAGCRDRRPPREQRAVLLPGRIRFATRSTVWGGGIAFYDHAADGPTPARAYLMTAAQFVDVAAQEMHREAREGDPLEQVVAAGLSEGTFRAGPGKYETLLRVGEIDDRPLLTFTAPDGGADLEPLTPVPAYLDMLARGLEEAHGWDRDRSSDYFATVGALAPTEVSQSASATSSSRWVATS